MFEVGLPIQLRHRELHGNLPLLFANVEHLQELVKENYIKGHAARISEILLWIAINHPEVLKDDSKLLYPISITNLCFRDSYENLDMLIPIEALITLLRSRVCRKVNKFCGYINPHILNMDSLQYVEIVKLALGRHNIDLFIQKPSFMDQLYSSQEIVIHLLCCELDQEDLESLPIMPVYDDKTIYISDVTDQDVPWVLQAAEALNRQERDQDCLIKLKRSKLTATGFEAIANGLSELKLKGGLTSWSLGVSSPHIGHCVVEILGYEESEELYFDRMSHMYDMECFSFTEKEYEEEFLWESLQIDI